MEELVDVLYQYSAELNQYPLGRTGVDKATEECLETLVDTLGLPVCLRVVTCAHAQRDLDQLEELLPKCTCKNPVPVGHNRVREAMEPIDVIEEHFSNISS